MQRSSSKRQKAKGHGELGQVAVSTHGARACAAGPEPTAFERGEPAHACAGVRRGFDPALASLA